MSALHLLSRHPSLELCRDIHVSCPSEQPRRAAYRESVTTGGDHTERSRSTLLPRAWKMLLPPTSPIVSRTYYF